MLKDHRALLSRIKNFDQLIGYLRDEMGWPIESNDLEELTYDYSTEELGIDVKTAAKIVSIKKLRPLSINQPWGIFFVEFELKRLPVVALRRILSRVTLKKRASANTSERAAWAANDLLFISNYGKRDERTITFAHFSYDETKQDLPILKVLGWNDEDTALHLDGVVHQLTSKLTWPEHDKTLDSWRKQWRSAFTVHHREVITTSKDLSIHLAKLAQTIRKRINSALAVETERGPLTKLMKAFQDALIHDLDEDGFADMYAQTIAYGLLSTRVLNPKSGTADELHIQIPVTNPFLKELMETFIHVGGRHVNAGGPNIDFDELGVNEIVELLDEANMDAVIRDFGDRNPQEDPVIHFYELFLKEYDAKKRVQRGVFYTPRPVVSYIVRSIDETLRTEFGLQDGLADITTWGQMANDHKYLQIPKGTSPDETFIKILDPATGTGTFLVETIDLIYHTLQAKWKSQGHNEKQLKELWNEYVPKYLLPRLHGYELLMAPYAIAHLKIGLKLYETGYIFDSDERARVYLTNTLEPSSDIGQLTLSGITKAIANEAQAVNEIKRNQRFTVIIGNPPYSLYTANLTEAGNRLIEPFRSIEGKAVRERGALQLEKNLQDDYVKFFGFCLNALRHSGLGALGFISNHGYLNNRTLRGMRYTLMKFFGHIYFVDLHGSTSRATKQSRDVLDQNVFEIQQGVAIGIFTKSPNQQPSFFYSQLLGPRNLKYEWLLSHKLLDTDWSRIQPSPPHFVFEPRNSNTEKEYYAYIALNEIFPLYSTGIVSARDSLVIQIRRSEVESTIQRLSQLTTEKARSEYNLGADTKDWAVSRAQNDVRKALRRGVVPSQILYRPFDIRWTFYTGQARGFMCNPRRPVMAGMVDGTNLALCVNRQVNSEFRHVIATRLLATDCTLSTATRERTYVFPLYNTKAEHRVLRGASSNLNISPLYLVRLTECLSLKPQNDMNDCSSGLIAEDIFYYLYAILHSQKYRSRYADFLKTDFPRLPLTNSLELFRALSLLGSELVDLHLMVSSILDKPITEFISSNNDKIEKISWSNNTVWINKGLTSGLKGVPKEVWNFYIGGYRVCEKWLKDRKGRPLSKEDIYHYQRIIAALSETILIMQEIEKIIEKHKGWPEAFDLGEKNSATLKKNLLDF